MWRGGDLLVRAHVLDLVQLLHFSLDDRRPVIELAAVRIGQRILILRLGEPAADVDVLPGLHEEEGARDLCHLGAQALDDLLGRGVALLEGLELNEKARRALARIAAGRAGEPDHRVDRGIAE